MRKLANILVAYALACSTLANAAPAVDPQLAERCAYAKQNGTQRLVRQIVRAELRLSLAQNVDPQQAPSAEHWLRMACNQATPPHQARSAH